MNVNTNGSLYGIFFLLLGRGRRDRCVIDNVDIVGVGRLDMFVQCECECVFIWWGGRGEEGNGGTSKEPNVKTPLGCLETPSRTFTVSLDGDLVRELGPA